MNTTTWWIIAIIAVAIGYDVFAMWRWGYHGTISFDALNAAKNYPIIGVAVGVVIGHIFWPQ